MGFFSLPKLDIGKCTKQEAIFYVLVTIIFMASVLGILIK